MIIFILYTLSFVFYSTYSSGKKYEYKHCRVGSTNNNNNNLPCSVATALCSLGALPPTFVTVFFFLFIYLITKHLSCRWISSTFVHKILSYLVYCLVKEHVFFFTCMLFSQRDWTRQTLLTLTIFLMISLRVPPLIYSAMKFSLLSLYRTPMNLSTLGWSRQRMTFTWGDGTQKYRQIIMYYFIVIFSPSIIKH